MIVPVRTDRVGRGGFRQAGYAEAVVGRPEGDVAVGANVRGCECLIIERVGEWEGNDRAAVIDVVADIGRPRDDAAGRDGVGVVGAWRCWRWGWSW